MNLKRKEMVITMYVKKTSDREPYQVIVTKKELKEAFKNRVSYELFRQALISQVLVIDYQSRENHKYDILEDEENV